MDDLDNSTLTSKSPDLDLPRPMFIFHGLVIAASVSGLVLNLFNIVILSRLIKRLNSHSCMVLNQCCCCTLICLFTLIEHSFRYQERFSLYYDTRCVIMVTTIATKSSYVAIFLNMILVTFSRFVAVCRPTAYPRMFTAKRTTLMIAVILAVAGLLVVAQFIYVAVKYVQGSFCFAYFRYGGSYVVDGGLGILVAILLVMIPCVYTYLVVATRRKRSLAHNTRIRTKSSVTVTSFWIVISFVLSYTSYYVIRFFARQNEELLKISLYVVIPIVLNCTLDPLVYAVRLPDIRAGYVACWKQTTGKQTCAAPGQTSTLDLDYSVRLPTTAD